MLGRRLPAADCGLRAISAETETALDLGEEAAAGVELGRGGAFLYDVRTEGEGCQLVREVA